MSHAHDSWGSDPDGDEGANVKWMTYAELGLARGITAASAKRLASRRKWRRQADNDGIARIAVPDHDDPRRIGSAQAATEDFVRIISGLEVSVSTLRDQLERERGRADGVTEDLLRSEEQLAETEGRIAKLAAAAETAALVRDALERALTAEEKARAKAEAALATERALAANAEAEAAALRQTERDRRALGRTARLRAAWRGE
jgi:hypothetical protein